MKKLLQVILAIAFVGLIALQGYSAQNDKFSVEGVRVTSDGELGYKILNELATTSDTLTASESGIVILVNATTPATFTLPSAAAGLTYKIVSVTNKRFYVDPNGSDTIHYKPSSGALLSAGDRIESPAATGDSIEFYATTTSTWYVNTSDAFVDGN